MYYYGRRDRKTWQPFGVYVHQYSRLVIGSFPAPAELSIKPAGTVYIIIFYMHAPTLRRRIYTYGGGGGGTKTLQLELPVAAHPLVKQNT